jgi:hypothetical protein
MVQNETCRAPNDLIARGDLILAASTEHGLIRFTENLNLWKCFCRIVKAIRPEPYFVPVIQNTQSRKKWNSVDENQCTCRFE